FTSSLLASSKFSTKSGTSSSSSNVVFPTALPATVLANRFSCVKPSGPSWLNIPGSISNLAMSRVVLSNSNLRIDMHINVDGGHGSR
ncbi:hypothetical protein ALC56_03733, partial [Trachymyrmex septentrionalis]